MSVAAVALSLRPTRPVRQWQLNVATLTGRVPDRALTRRALWSWARNTIESLHLGHLSREQIDASIVMSPADEQRLRGLAAHPGAVAALPHMGSWDLAGAWACGVDMPVATVAEQLLSKEFALFRSVRERLGFQVHGHREPDLVHTLVDAVQSGLLVCLLADRDFSRRGVPVVWPAVDPTGRPSPLAATMPAGPAQVALRSGSALLGVACHYEGPRVRLVVSQPIAASGGGDAEQQVTAMTQALCTFFADQIRQHPQDWHMMQPIFPGVRA